MMIMNAPITDQAECPCGSTATYGTCCGPFHAGTTLPPTPEALMRSRYAAFVAHNVDYIEQTLSPESRVDFNRDHVQAWAMESEWLGLSILSSEGGTEPGDTTGFVEFVARFKVGDKDYAHHESSRFEKIDGRWMYVDGNTGPRTVRLKTPKAGRNDPCPCGSGKKFKKCCNA
ncbi:YchJ family protein [Haematospirillum sp. H1815]|uniref:YchJ family protein n=1 Tax=Haematospirillum sp. H1815 TaxID=2723108 RepID=UPI001FD79F20|nr:YchJ family protein [Haematospirillum sp. H1815]